MSQESRERVREMKEIVDASLEHESLGDYARAGALAAQAAILLSDFVANEMTHGNLQAAQRMARHHARMYDVMNKHIPEGLGYE